MMQSAMPSGSGTCLDHELAAGNVSQLAKYKLPESQGEGQNPRALLATLGRARGLPQYRLRSPTEGGVESTDGCVGLMPIQGYESTPDEGHPVAHSETEDRHSSKAGGLPAGQLEVGPLILQTATETMSILVEGSPGKWLRRHLKKRRVLTAAKEVLWGWPAQQSIIGWLQLIGGRPQAGSGPPLGEWRVQSVEVGGWGAKLRQGNTA